MATVAKGQLRVIIDVLMEKANGRASEEAAGTTTVLHTYLEVLIAKEA